MPAFTNQATLRYNDIVTNSNIVTGQIVEVLSATKTALTQSYAPGDAVTYVVSIVNSGTLPFTGLQLSDDLGGYLFGEETLYPLTYDEGSVLYLQDGATQPAPAATAGPPLVFDGITVPAGGNATLIYQATANRFAPLGTTDQITNTVSITGGGLSSPVTAQEAVSARTGADLSITKAVSPVPVAENGLLTYTFVIRNQGNTAAATTDNLLVTDTFDPILSGLTVTLDGAALTEGTDYTYDPATGEFTTTAGRITVPAAEIAQTADGSWSVTPGTATLVVTGTV